MLSGGKMMGDFDQVVRSVNCQFFAFFIGYMTRIIGISYFRFTDYEGENFENTVYLA